MSIYCKRRKTVGYMASPYVVKCVGETARLAVGLKKFQRTNSACFELWLEMVVKLVAVKMKIGQIDQIDLI